MTDRYGPRWRLAYNSKRTALNGTPGGPALEIHGSVTGRIIPNEPQPQGQTLNPLLNVLQFPGKR